jgi:hypothetical protein
MMKRNCLLFAFIVSLIFVLAPPSPAGFVPYISGTSTATLIESGDFAGMYRYDISIDWKVRKSSSKISQIDLLLTDITQDSDYEVDFSSPAAYSNNRRHHNNLHAATWNASLESSGLSLFGEDDPYIQYVYAATRHSSKLTKNGSGTFSFYSDIAPEYGTFDDVLLAQLNCSQKILGDLTGAYPYFSPDIGGGTGGDTGGGTGGGTSTPEPATITLLSLGGCLAALRKKR